MNWGEFKAIVEVQGVEDATPVWFIDVRRLNDERQVRVLLHSTRGAGILNAAATVGPGALSEMAPDLGTQGATSGSGGEPGPSEPTGGTGSGTWPLKGGGTIGGVYRMGLAMESGSLLEAPPGVVAGQTVTTSTAPTSLPPTGRTQGILALLTFAGFLAVLGALISVQIPASASNLLSIMLGALTSGVATVLSYYFGSSAGSARKTELIHEGK